eukprot:2751362-Amphidinium_carterae.1
MPVRVDPAPPQPHPAATPLKRRRLTKKQKVLEADEASSNVRVVQKKPTTVQGESHCCTGQPEFKCRYSTSGAGQRARARHACVFCSPTAMEKACNTAGGKGNVLRALKFFRSFYTQDPTVHNSAILV